MIETERLTLAPLEPQHAAGPYLEWINHPEVNRFLESRFTQYGEDDLRCYIKAANADPSLHLFGIFAQGGGDHLGNIKLGPVNRDHARGDIGLALWKPAWGKGYGAEAIAGISRYAFEELRLHKVTAGCYTENTGAIHAFLKVGFHREGQLRSHYRYEGTWIDGVLLGLTAGDA